jgi:hypothetical protein
MLVTSGVDVNLAYGTATYQQIFRDNAFGNYEDILTKVTLSSVMGDYLNMVNNDKPANGVNPNELRARRGSFTFSDRNAASFAYTVNGVAQTKPITREVFRSPGTLCQQAMRRRNAACGNKVVQNWFTAVPVAGITSCTIGLPV